MIDCRRAAPHVTAILLALMTFIFCGSTTAQLIPGRRIRGPVQAGMVNLPYVASNNQGDQWMVYPGGMVNMQGNAPVFSQAAQLIVNGNQPNVQGNTAKLDDKTGELVLDNLSAASFTITRRIMFNTDEGYVRFIDIFKNTQAQDQPANILVSSNLNFGVQSSTSVADPKKKDQVLGWVAQLMGPGRAAVEVYAGKGSKVAPTINWPRGNNFAQTVFTLTVPANKEIAIVHVHAIAASQDAGVQWVNNLKEDKLLADVPREIRKLIINFPAHANLLGDLDILRGDVLDVVELRGGDRFNGNLSETSYHLDTFYGAIDLPVDKVISILNTGQFRPRQLIVTADGQIFGGHLAKQTIDLELSSGQKTQIPLAQISRIGYRHRASETDDSSAPQSLQPPYVLMTSGDRVGVVMPTDPITVNSRYGALQLPAAAISSIAFASEESPVHTIFLNDGSRFNALVSAGELEMKLSSTPKQQTVKFPVGTIARLVLKNLPDDKDDSAATVKLKKDDQFTGTLQGQLKLDTTFDTLTLNAPEIRGLAHARENSPDISIKTWDGTVFSGQLEQQQVSCHLASGIDVQIPIDLVQAYSNPQAQVPAMMVDRIKAVVADLNNDDWKQRDAAEQQLVKLGPGVAITLKSLRDSQPPEAQQRIDSVLKQLDKQSTTDSPLPQALSGPDARD